MGRQLTVLDRVEVASPCHAEWDLMVGDDRVRFCERCALNVYNLSAMPRGEAERLVQTTEGRLCVRFYRRADGTLLTENCPVGWRAARLRVKLVATGIAAAFAGLTGLAWNRPQPMMGRMAVSERSDHPPMPSPDDEPVAFMGTPELPQAPLQGRVGARAVVRAVPPRYKKSPPR